MPDPSKLSVGDVIRMLCVPAIDLAQREREIATNAEMAGWTADTIERIIGTNPLVTVFQIDENGMPWYEAELINAEGQIEYHSLLIYNDDSWELHAAG